MNERKTNIKSRLWLPALILELGAIGFLVLSMTKGFGLGESNRYLPAALGLNCIAVLVNLIAGRKQKRKDDQNK